METTTTDLTIYAATPAQADAILRVVWAAERDLGASTRIVAFRLDADYGAGQGHVTLESGGYLNVVLEDGTTTDEAP
jgi:hypothetical protein